MDYTLTNLANGLPVILSAATDTPRSALAICIRGGIAREDYPGIARMASRLLLKGTTHRDAETLAHELDARAIETRELALPDCQVLTATFLHRELPAVVDLLADMLRHSTFADFEKEREKWVGEINASLDLPAEMAQDLLVRTLFAGSPYGYTSTRVLETLPALPADAVPRWYADGLRAGAMCVALVGVDPDEALPRLADAFTPLTGDGLPADMPVPAPPAADRLVTQARADAQQAQIFQGWLAPPLGSAEQAATAVMNTVLGGGGLSSRLFLELRDKQGLAYSVRSMYAPLRRVGELIVSIGTSPENIARARQGFTEQITRMQQEPISIEELLFAKGRLAGAYVLSHETSTQQCLDMAINACHGMGPDYSERLLAQMQAVTIADVQAAAQRLHAPSVTAIVAREDALPAE